MQSNHATEKQVTVVQDINILVQFDVLSFLDFIQFDLLYNHYLKWEMQKFILLNKCIFDSQLGLQKNRE